MRELCEGTNQDASGCSHTWRKKTILDGSRTFTSARVVIPSVLIAHIRRCGRRWLRRRGKKRDVPLSRCGGNCKLLQPIHEYPTLRLINVKRARSTTKPINGWVEMDKYYYRKAMGRRKPPINVWADIDRYSRRKAIGIIDEDDDETSTESGSIG